MALLIIFVLLLVIKVTRVFLSKRIGCSLTRKTTQVEIDGLPKIPSEPRALSYFDHAAALCRVFVKHLREKLLNFNILNQVKVDWVSASQL